MVQYLDLNGLRTVVDNVKNIKSPVCLPVHEGSKFLTFGITIKNDTAPSYTAIVYNHGSSRFLAQYNDKTYYTKWNADDTHLSYDKYGTHTTSGVEPKVGYLYAISSNSTLQVCFQAGKLTSVANYTPQLSWNTVTTSPFVRSEYIKSIQRVDTGNGTYLWKITVNNVDSESQLFNVQNHTSNEFIQFGVYLDAKQEGTFTIELSKTVPNNYFDVTF